MQESLWFLRLQYEQGNEPSHLTLRVLHKSHAAEMRSSRRRFSGRAASMSRVRRGSEIEVGGRRRNKASDGSSQRGRRNKSSDVNAGIERKHTSSLSWLHSYNSTRYRPLSIRLHHKDIVRVGTAGEEGVRS